MTDETPIGSGHAEAPFVSIIIPCRNEARHIEACLRGILAQDYPRDRMEIIVADGMSDDGTRDIIARIAQEDGRVHLVDNPKRITPAGLNTAIKASRGEVIIRVDGHADVATDFVKQSVAVLAEHPEAWGVGGPIVHCAERLFGKAVAIAMAHPLGVGLARHRFEGYEGYAEGAQFPALRRWVFDAIGMFDETLVRNQDDEFNYRIWQAGGKVYVSPRIRYRYFVRETPSQLFRQYLQYGFWRVAVIRKYRRPTTLRQLVPPMFCVALAACTVLGALLRHPLVAAIPIAAYIVGLLGAAVSVTPRVGTRVASHVPIAMAIIHVAYGLGFLLGLVSALRQRPSAGVENGMSALSR